ncbi:ABC transporter ATP-binding protein [Variovorax sp. UMC13]|uniref:ABC transporter ATP-binding protein n=1 Tax=Variovorax sp. UMC13 TaxID=1862326 RepID=UPI001600B533|nr:ABC transporter ATP-binding protein [Variovorax sp. UMC13]MBB1599395.1 peptide ABC transporter ATP-binding protein [Variovorax sp. UMC13]
MNSPALLEVRDLALALRNGTPLVHGIGFEVRPGEIVGIVGESGSGKTLAARSVMGLAPPAIQRTGGAIRFEGQDITQLAPAALRKLRGARMGMVFQEPMTSLNPSMPIGRQLDEGLALHTRLTPAERRARILEMLARVRIDDPIGALAAYPHRFSGGMRQRIMLASAMLLRPALLIADEPTTALDAIVQRDVLELMVGLTREHGTAVLMISHDLPMIARYTDRIVVMHHGRIVEQGPTAALVTAPQEAYTRKLLAAMPQRGATRAPSAAPPVLEVDGLVVDYPGSGGLFTKREARRALHGIDLRVGAGEVVALVGGSGSGKTTLGRTIAGLIRPSAGSLRFEGKPIVPGGEGWARYRAQCQMVFQDPVSSLDPRMTVAALIGEALRTVPGLTPAAKQARIAEVLDEVALSADVAQRYAHELSGGQRQRVAIARAVVRRPAFIVADEPVSALDVTVRAQILTLFAQLQSRHGFSCLFISHDLGVVEQIADRVVVMRQGAIVEAGLRDQVFDRPADAYTQELLGAVPRLHTALAQRVLADQAA